jgi:hypothetical protein
MTGPLHNKNSPPPLAHSPTPAASSLAHVSPIARSPCVCITNPNPKATLHSAHLPLCALPLYLSVALSALAFSPLVVSRSLRIPVLPAFVRPADRSSIVAASSVSVVLVLEWRGARGPCSGSSNRPPLTCVPRP